MRAKINLQKKRILLTGGAGFLGQHIAEKLRKRGVTHVIIPRSTQYDLRTAQACRSVMRNIDIVIHLAAKVGGIGFNRAHPAEMFYDNIMMGVQLMHEAASAKVEKFVAIGTICSYPKFTTVPFKEETLWDGYPEETNAPYGLAKKMLLVQSQAYRAQYGFNSIFLLPVNLYGPGDNFDTTSSHVIPALIKKLYEAKTKKKKEVAIWGTGKATREFLYVDDAAEAIVLATELYNRSDPVNIGAGFEISIHALALQIAKLIGFTGKLRWDTSKPDGQPRRMLDSSKAYRLFKFKATMKFEEGLKKEIEWYETHVASK